jgi:hypothetical protein
MMEAGAHKQPFRRTGRAGLTVHYSLSMKPTGSAPGAGMWGSPNEVFDRLEGRWTLHRSIPGSAEMKGTATFSRLPSGLLGFHEQGRVRLPDGKEFDGFRDYFFERAVNGFTVLFAETPMRIFHRITVTVDIGKMVGTASHLCIADQYDSRYTFHADGGFAIEHTVNGPRKGYVSHTEFTRLA